jgi:HPr kinase/phosphorylase
MEEFTVEQLYEDNKDKLYLKLLSHKGSFDRIISEGELHRPGLALTGFTDVFTYWRVQILGNTELAYLETISSVERKKALTKVLSFDIPCIIITDNNRPPRVLINMADRRQISLFGTPHNTTTCIHLLGDYLDQKFAPKATVHGSLVDVYGVGMLFTGKSGIGKSEVAIDLVERGHRLVADDIVHITRTAEGVLMGESDELLRDHAEVRGLGIINVRTMFGIQAVRVRKLIEVQVDLQEWSDELDYERVGMDQETTQILEAEIPLVRLPIIPGKNITVIAEVIALHHLMKIRGYRTAEVFNQKLMEKMREMKEKVFPGHKPQKTIE